ncbi:retrovirus-related Pol polyprotein from transposon TNT 1-94 [Trifolium pratense]|uniref:Retrovirus-related Pol polyprotein from transposon TNT 1-94 n=1 Tax=Trifolium pratense TaxID=57577 RepID=A0A2K3MAR4_TRIPR|nr:retrovirus-related Pol polyprotein from transposon TNT 1-94 [Trifolium pratense]
MLAGRNVPKTFWPEAVKWATYVMNRSPTLSVKNMTPEEAWSGNKPTVHHFRVFGCLAFAHIPDAQRTKLDDKSIKCILLGVSDESKAYKLCDPKKQKIIVSRDVIFEEKKVTVETSDDDDESDSDMSEPLNPIQNPSDSDNENQASTSLAPRNRRPPAGLSDYVLGSELDNEEELHNLAIYTPAEDPKTYEEAAKLDIWKNAMDQEMESIKNNDT